MNGLNNSLLILLLGILVASCGGSDPFDLKNDAPNVHIKAPSNVGLKAEVKLDGSASKDVDGDIKTYLWTQDKDDKVQVVLTDANKSIASFTMPESYVGVLALHFTLSVTDLEGKTANKTITVNLNGTAAYKVSGRVVVAAGNHMDSDINNPEARYKSNDTIDEPQLINSPSRVAGYVNVSGAGPDGRSKAAGDRSDFYQLDLLGDQILELQYFTDGKSDFDLYLYDYQHNLVNIALAGYIDSNDNKEILYLRAPETGRFLVQVYAATGAGNYRLSALEAEGYTFLPGVLSLDHDFVAGEVLIKKTAGVSLLAKRKKIASATLISGKEGRVSRYRLNNQNTQKTSNKRLQQGVSGANRYARSARITSGISAAVNTLREIVTLRDRADIEFAEPNYYRQANAVPNDPLYAQQSWHYDMVNLPKAWDITTGSNSVVVAVLDTGILAAHPDLSLGAKIAGYDFISDKENSFDGDGIDDNPEDSANVYHGTHVAGTILADSNNGLGVAGVNWNASLMTVRVIGRFGATTYDGIQGMLYAAGLPNDSKTVPSQRADVINMSFGGSGYSSIEQLIINQIRRQNILVVASAGNDASRQNNYPAAYDGVISVGAVAVNKSLAPYSNSGPTVDIVAPGGNTKVDDDQDGYKDGVLSTAASTSNGFFSYTYEYYQGTSMSAPHITGVIALMKSVYPEMSPADFDDWLSRGILTEDLGTYGRDNVFGNGLIDAFKAVKVAITASTGGSVENPPRMHVSPEGLNFGYEQTELEFVTTALGRGGKLAIYAIHADRSWLSIKKSQVDEHRYGIYTVKVDRSKLISGLYQGKIIIQTAKGDYHLGIVVNASKRIPFVFTTLKMLLYDFHIDPMLQNPLFAENATQIFMDKGVYDYQLENVPLGKYRFFAGIDMDNDHSYSYTHFDPVGIPQYPDNPLINWLDVVGDIEGLDFSVDIY